MPVTRNCVIDVSPERAPAVKGAFAVYVPVSGLNVESLKNAIQSAEVTANGQTTIAAFPEALVVIVYVCFLLTSPVFNETAVGTLD